ncbi:ribbon-helix-helix protein, CopG family [Neisseria sicca]|nr:ribbon-helix-helix protein, CopG family [Neisseria sicca]
MMALSRTEIQKRSNEKRGIVQKNFKLPAETVELIKTEAEKRGIPQAALIALAVKSLSEG